MNWINLIPGGSITVLLGAIVAILGAFGIVSRKATVAERNRNKAKEAEARAKNLQDVKDAIRAGKSAPLDFDSSLSDPNNRDTRK